MGYLLFWFGFTIGMGLLLAFFPAGGVIIGLGIALVMMYVYVFHGGED